MTALALLDAAQKTKLAQCEAVIRRGLNAFVEVGDALATVRDEKLYQEQYETFESYCREQWGLERRHAYRLMDAAQVIENVSNWTQIVPATESQARPLTALEPEQQAEAWQRAVETAPNGKITAAHVQDVVDTMLARSSGPARDFDAYVAEREAREPEPVKPAWYQSSESDDWWTPQWLFDLLDAEIGFETDVCASEANHKCDRFFTREQDALRQEWHGRCWMNPPYGRSGGTSIYQWIDAAYRSALHGATVACFIPARTDTTWWWDFCIHGEVRFLKGRIKFANSDSIAPFPSAIVIFWPSVPKQQAQVKWWNVNGLAPVED